MSTEPTDAVAPARSCRKSREQTIRDLLLALDMADAGIAMVAARLRRTHPGAGDAEILEMVNAWLLDRPPDVAPTAPAAP